MCSQIILLYVGYLEPLAVQTLCSIAARGSIWWETHSSELKLNYNFRMAYCPSQHHGRGRVISEEEKIGMWGLKKEIKKTFLKKDGPGWSRSTFWDTLTVQLWFLARLPGTGEPWECNSTEQWSGGNMNNSSLQREGKQQKVLSEEKPTTDH